MKKGLLKRVVAPILAMTMTVSSVNVFAASVNQYVDMPTNWAATAVAAAVENGLLTGVSATELAPFDNITRAQVAAILVRAFGAKNKADLSMFSDVVPGAWYEGELAKAVAMGIMQGANGKIRPNDEVTREEAFVMIARVFGLTNGSSSALSSFTDAAEVSSWAKGSLAALVENGSVNGANGKLNPKNKITRAEFAQVMYSLVNVYVTKDGKYSNDVNGNLVVSTSDVVLKDMTINGDLIIADGVGSGIIELKGVTVTGKIIVRSQNAEIIMDDESSSKDVVYVNGSSNSSSEETTKDEEEETEKTTEDEDATEETTKKSYATSSGGGGRGSSGGSSESSSINISSDRTGNKYTKDVNITAAGVTLKNVSIDGDLAILKNVKDGEITLNNVTVTGKVYVYGSGDDSEEKYLNIINSDFDDVIVNKTITDESVVIYLDKDSSIKNLDAKTSVILKGDGAYSNLDVDGKAASIVIDEGVVVDTVNVEEASQVTVNGLVDNLVINGSGVNLKVGATVSIGKIKVNAKDITIIIPEDADPIIIEVAEDVADSINVDDKSGKSEITIVPSEETTTEKATESTTEATTEATTVATTEATTEATTVATTESTTVATTETTTEATTESTTEATTVATTEATTESTTEATTEATTESTTEATTESTTEATTEVQYMIYLGTPANSQRYTLSGYASDSLINLIEEELNERIELNNYSATTLLNYFSRALDLILSIAIEDVYNDDYDASKPEDREKAKQAVKNIFANAGAEFDEAAFEALDPTKVDANSKDEVVAYVKNFIENYKKAFPIGNAGCAALAEKIKDDYPNGRIITTPGGVETTGQEREVITAVLLDWDMTISEIVEKFGNKATVKRENGERYVSVEFVEKTE